MDTRIVMLTPYTLSHRTAEETLALGYLSKVLRQNNREYDVLVIDGWLESLTAQQIVERACVDKPPSVICFSCYRSNLEEAGVLLRLFHEKVGYYVPSICGGYGPTFHDEDFIDAGFTVAVRGEAEHIITDLVSVLCQQGLSLETIPGITFRKQNVVIRTRPSMPIQDLDILPFPDRDSIASTIKRKNPVHVCTSRGCMAHCTFCSVIAFARAAGGSSWRLRSVKNIVDELRQLHEYYGVCDFKFVDDSFIEPPRNERWVAEFAELLVKAGLSIRFRTQVRADRLTRQIVSGLTEAGWFSTSIGIESGSREALRRMAKSATLEDNIHALALLKDHGIYTQMGMILFDHATTIRELEENYHFLRAHAWVVTKGIFTEMFAAKGTTFTKNLIRKQLVRSGQLTQNFSYEVGDPLVRRVYWLLKQWHRAHAAVYDWVIDSIGAPKILPNKGYEETYQLCKLLLQLDLSFFRKTLDHIQTDKEGDGELVDQAISETEYQYAVIGNDIRRIYEKYDLIYDGVLNPFLS